MKDDEKREATWAPVPDGISRTVMSMKSAERASYARKALQKDGFGKAKKKAKNKAARKARKKNRG